MSRFVRSRSLEKAAVSFLTVFYVLSIGLSNLGRSEPSSRATLIGEQPNAWELLHPRAVASRHRGAEHCRR